MEPHRATSRLVTLKGLLIGAAALAVAGAASQANASITYDVNQTIGAGSVTGTITTDGAIGVLSASDFTAWNLLLTGAGGATFVLTNGSSGVEVGNISDPFNPNAGTPDLTADAQNIYFNFDGLDGGYLGFQTLPLYGGQNYWCNASLGNNFDCATGKTVVPVNAFDPSTQTALASGNQIIASVAGGAVPEPAGWAMMLLGFGGLGALIRGRRRPVSA